MSLLAFWLEIPKHFPQVVLDEYVIMPDHMHGILIIKDQGHLVIEKSIKKDFSFETLIAEMEEWENQRLMNENLPERISRRLYSSEHMAEISPKPGSLAAIIRSYKSVVSKYARKIDNSFEWQGRYYDRIIKDPFFMDKVRDYIYMNPQNWGRKESSEI